ncbi:MAG TPA: HxsD-like protein [Candidatus Portnoybacteria bacterium]|nr:HxsD-like protein [Candidatus Portnoybacteria bacterium]
MEIVFDKKLYKLEAIRSAIGAFAGLADFVLKSNQRGIAVKISNIDPEAADIIDGEFANYVLAQMKK